MNSRSILIWLAVYAISMAYLESAVVVYLRLLYYPDGFVVGGAVLPDWTLGVEIGREAATILMIGAVSLVSARRSWLDRTANFFYVFGIWDIFYYVFLKVLLDWPESLLTTDVYFLIPVPWVGPVIVPVLCSILIVAAAGLMKWRLSKIC
jgi:hypothetical protein